MTLVALLHIRCLVQLTLVGAPRQLSGPLWKWPEPLWPKIHPQVQLLMTSHGDEIPTQRFSRNTNTLSDLKLLFLKKSKCIAEHYLPQSQYSVWNSPVGFIDTTVIPVCEVPTSQGLQWMLKQWSLYTPWFSPLHKPVIGSNPETKSSTCWDWQKLMVT